MIKNKVIVTIFFSVLLNSFVSNANSKVQINKTKSSTTAENTSQKIIDDFHVYASAIKPEIREEIKKYRLQIVEINKKKQGLYNSLSQEAQKFLAEEQKYKKKLSISKSSLEEIDKKNSDKSQ